MKPTETRARTIESKNKNKHRRELAVENIPESELDEEIFDERIQGQEIQEAIIPGAIIKYQWREETPPRLNAY